MFLPLLKKTILALCVLSVSLAAVGQTGNEPKSTPPEWSKPYPAFRIAGQLYYVGTDDLACYLVVTPKGNILINTGLSASAGLIRDNIASLGFKLSDVKILLTMQAHYDHMGAMAELKKITHAKFMVDSSDSSVVADGGASDYALGDNGSAYAPVKVDRYLHNQDVISLGGMRITLLHHPGHTKGSCSFLFEVKDEQRSYKVLLANMPTIVTEHDFNSISAYPTVAQDYAYTLSAMKGLQFDLWLSSHASQFNLHGKHTPGDAYNPMAFADQKGYDEAMIDLQQKFDKKVKPLK